MCFLAILISWMYLIYEEKKTGFGIIHYLKYHSIYNIQYLNDARIFDRTKFLIGVK